MRSAPVRDDQAVPVPFVSDDFFRQISALAQMLAPVQVVGSHQRESAAFLKGRSERRQVNLVQRPVVDLDVYPQPFRLLTVQREVLRTGRCACGLNTAYHRRGCRSCEERILAHIFEIASAQRSPLDVQARSENHVLSSCPSLFAEHESGHFDNVGIPGCGQSAAAGQVACRLF